MSIEVFLSQAYAWITDPSLTIQETRQTQECERVAGTRTRGTDIVPAENRNINAPVPRASPKKPQVEGFLRIIITPLLILFLPISAFAQSEAPAQSAAPHPPTVGDDILNMDVEQLAKVDVRVPSMDIPVTSVAKEQSTVGRSAAAVFVITNEMIRRSGATCIPEALRMAPGLDVAQVNSSTWAISARGFNDVIANKLLVLIDGRTVYSPVFSGVYWDVQDYVMEDIERIEVIRGPGGTLWGANAVNGVINVITKKAKDSQGTYASVIGGTVERQTEVFRYGGQFGENCQYRVYGKYFDRGSFYDPNQPANDAWDQGRFGFRADWDLDDANSLTVQGDHYVGTSGLDAFHTLLVSPYYLPLEGSVRNTGENVLARFRHVYNKDSDWMLQTYLDNFQRLNSVLNSELVKTFDLELQYRFPLTERQQITCGAGYRYVQEDCPSVDPFTASVIPIEQDIYVVNQFLQDEISLIPDKLNLIVGCKLEQNTYTHFEYQPTIRLLWTPDRQHTLWGAVSRAVRTPSAIDRGLFYTGPPVYDTVFLRLRGSEAFLSETLMAYEIGYRTQMTEKFSWDIATFYNVYDGIRGQITYPPEIELVPTPPHLILPNVFANILGVHSYGVELNISWNISERWRLATYYTYLEMDVYGQTAATAAALAGQSPRHQVYFRSSWDLRKDVDFDLMARYVNCLPEFPVPSYIEMDLRLAWRPRKRLELALVGQNLLQAHHYEFGSTPQALGLEVTEVPRSVYGSVTWRR